MFHCLTQVRRNFGNNNCFDNKDEAVWVFGRKSIEIGQELSSSSAGVIIAVWRGERLINANLNLKNEIIGVLDNRIV
jgi:hypothetical protein